jgi:cysteine dioxygenase
MDAAIADLFSPLQGRAGRLGLEELRRWLDEVPMGLEDVQPWVRFSSERYQRNLMYSGPAYHALVLCWRNGQRSPIHDHRGSACAVRVLQGVATETVFQRSAGGLVFPTHSRELPVGATMASEDEDIHQVSNLQADGADLVTLHVYSPPLLVMGSYSLTEDRVVDFVDPIHEFSQGGGI